MGFTFATIVALLVVGFIVALMFWGGKEDEKAVEEFFEESKAKARSSKETAIAAGPDKECPDCLTIVPSGARVCRACHHAFWYWRV